MLHNNADANIKFHYIQNCTMQWKESQVLLWLLTTISVSRDSRTTVIVHYSKWLKDFRKSACKTLMTTFTTADRHLSHVNKGKILPSLYIFNSYWVWLKKWSAVVKVAIKLTAEPSRSSGIYKCWCFDWCFEYNYVQMSLRNLCPRIPMACFS